MEIYSYCPICGEEIARGVTGEAYSYRLNKHIEKHIDILINKDLSNNK